MHCPWIHPNAVMSLRQPRQCNKLLCRTLLVAAIVLTLTQFVVQGFYLYIRAEHNVLKWPSRTTTLCGGNFTGYARLFLRMKSAVYDPASDKFLLGCKGERLPPKYSISTWHGRGAGKYINHIGHMTEVSFSGEIRKDGLTVIVDRSNSHNYYHAMEDWYNLFLLSKFFKFHLKKTRLFVFDNSPEFHIDTHWKLLFPRITYVKDIKTPLLLEDAIISIAGPSSPMGYLELEQLPYIEEFSQSFLSSFNLNSNKTLDCKNLTITLYIRRDYYYHPNTDFLQKRNTQRKFKNEDELLATLVRKFGGRHTVRTLVAEDMSLKEQLRLATETDILAGMHGCGFTNTLFMPRHAAIFEMYPKYWRVQNFFSALARWRGVKYRNWRNEEKENEFQDHYTYVPPDVLINNVNSLIKEIGCGS